MRTSISNSSWLFVYCSLLHISLVFHKLHLTKQAGGQGMRSRAPPLDDIRRYPHCVFFLDFVAQGIEFNGKIKRIVLKIH